MDWIPGKNELISYLNLELVRLFEFIQLPGISNALDTILFYQTVGTFQI